MKRLNDTRPRGALLAPFVVKCIDWSDKTVTIILPGYRPASFVKFEGAVLVENARKASPRVRCTDRRSFIASWELKGLSLVTKSGFVDTISLPLVGVLLGIKIVVECRRRKLLLNVLYENVSQLWTKELNCG